MVNSASSRRCGDPAGHPALALIALTLGLAHRAALYALVWTLWLPKGRDILFVYSDSPIWHEYMTTQILPLVQSRAVVLNWSERKLWPWLSLAVSVFHSFGGGREFNPLVIIFRPFARAKLFRFWQPFQDWKRGYRDLPKDWRRNCPRSSDSEQKSKTPSVCSTRGPSLSSYQLIIGTP
jgi:hypothetical protein